MATKEKHKKRSHRNHNDYKFFHSKDKSIHIKDKFTKIMEEVEVAGEIDE